MSNYAADDSDVISKQLQKLSAFREKRCFRTEGFAINECWCYEALGPGKSAPCPPQGSTNDSAVSNLSDDYSWLEGYRGLVRWQYPEGLWLIGTYYIYSDEVVEKVKGWLKDGQIKVVERLTGAPRDDLHWLTIGTDLVLDVVETFSVQHSNGYVTTMEPSSVPKIIRLTDAEGVEIVRRLSREGKIANVRKLNI